MTRPSHPQRSLFGWLLFTASFFPSLLLAQETQGVGDISPSVESRVSEFRSAPPKFLPNTAGQVWRTYDISQYTSRVDGVDKPEQAIVDWILRETGRDLWFNAPLGILSASSDQLLVYHTPEVQEQVRGVVEPLLASGPSPYLLQLRLISVGNPNWRSRALKFMKAIEVQSTGVDAWLISKGDAALLLGELSKRRDFKDHGSPRLVIPNGQSMTLSKRQPKTYTRGVDFDDQTWPGFKLRRSSIEEGFELTINPLVLPDQEKIDAVIRCEIDQVEKLRDVGADLQPQTGPTQRVHLQVPQVVSWRLHERFRWPTDKVLVLTCGIVATPETDGPSLAETLQLPTPLPSFASRSDALLFVELKGPASRAVGGTTRAASRSINYPQRY